MGIYDFKQELVLANFHNSKKDSYYLRYRMNISDIQFLFVNHAQI